MSKQHSVLGCCRCQGAPWRLLRIKSGPSVCVISAPDPGVCLRGFNYCSGVGEMERRGSLECDEGDSEFPRMLIPAAHPYGRIMPISEAQSPVHTPLHEERGQSASLQQLTLWWVPVFRPPLLEVKTPAPMQFVDSNLKGGRQGALENFRDLACGSGGQTHSCEKITSFLEVNTFTSIFGAFPAN